MQTIWECWVSTWWCFSSWEPSGLLSLRREKDNCRFKTWHEWIFLTESTELLFTLLRHSGSLLLKWCCNAIGCWVRTRELERQETWFTSANKLKYILDHDSKGRREMRLGCVTHWSLALLQVLTPDLWKGRLHELQQDTVVSLQAAGRTVKLEEHQSFQQAVNFLCRVRQ